MIYLDNAAGTKPYPQVVDVVTDTLTHDWGNASADNSLGYDARMIISDVTQQVVDDINCNPDNIVWTSGACEANSLAILGFTRQWYTRLYVSQLEHTSLNEIVKDLNNIGEHNVYFIKNNIDGLVILEDLKMQLERDKDSWLKPLVSISFANSEIGVIQDIKSISKLVHSYGGTLHVDATQMYPWYKIDVQELGIDLMSVSGQKMHSVKGVGFLYVRDSVKIKPLIFGSQQNGRRGGSYPTHLIAAFGKALELTRKNNATSNVEQLRNQLLNKLLLIEGVKLNGPCIYKNRLPNNISLTIDGVSAGTLTTMCDLMGIIIAKGSACRSYEPTPSEALLAIGLSPGQALNTIRISLDEFNTSEEIDYAADIITKLVERIRCDEKA